MEYWVLYLCSIADSVHTLLMVLGIIGGILSAFIIMMLAVLTPSTNQCYAIFGVGATLHYVNHSEEVQKIPDNAMKAVNRYLESLAPNDSIQ